MSASVLRCSSSTVMISRIVCFVLLFLFIGSLFLLASPIGPVERLLSFFFDSCKKSFDVSQGCSVKLGESCCVRREIAELSKRKNTHKHSHAPTRPTQRWSIDHLLLPIDAPRPPLLSFGALELARLA